MAQKKYYSSTKDLEMGIVKLIKMNEKQATMLFGSIKDKTPPQKLLFEKTRKLSYGNIPLKTLEYLWLGCKNSSIKVRIMAKSAYLCRVNEYNHPRVKMLFDYNENMWVVKEEEKKMIKDFYGLETHEERKENDSWD